MANQLTGRGPSNNASFFRSVIFSHPVPFGPRDDKFLRMFFRRRARTLSLAALAVAAAGCHERTWDPSDGGTSGDTGALVCTIQAPTACPDPMAHWPDVQPIFEHRCVLCHNGIPGGPWPLLQYSHVADWNDVVRAMLLDCSMPPPDAGVPMPDEERTAILTWILCGFPE